LLTVVQDLMGGSKKEGVRLFSRVCCDRMRGKWFQTKRGENQVGYKEEAFYGKDGAVPGRGCPEGWWMPCPWRHSRSGWRSSEHLMEL